MVPKFTLCLSGGGFRATLYHLGVVRALHDFRLLSNVTQIVSVSGGSILAAHLVLNWEKYCDTTSRDDEFRKIAKELIAFIKDDLRGKIVRRWLFAGWTRHFNRVDQLVAAYERLFKGALLESLGGEKRPGLAIMSSSFITGDLCAFTSRGVRTDCIAEPQNKEVALPGLSLSVAVAASSAFPPLFPPVILDRSNIPVIGKELLAGEILSDGGVLDNLGIATLTKDGTQLFISDASAAFAVKTKQNYGLIASRSIRASDILMTRVAALEQEKLQARGDKVLVAPISKIVEPDELPALQLSKEPLPLQTPAMQQTVQFVRTDLDRFSDLEIDTIYRHGYEVALATIAPLLDRNDLWRRGLLQNPLPWRPSENSSRSDDQRAAEKQILEKMAKLVQHSLVGTPFTEDKQGSNPDELAQMRLAGQRKIRLWDRYDPFCKGITVLAGSVALCVVGFWIWKLLL